MFFSFLSTVRRKKTKQWLKDSLYKSQNTTVFFFHFPYLHQSMHRTDVILFVYMFRHFVPNNLRNNLLHIRKERIDQIFQWGRKLSYWSIIALIAMIASILGHGFSRGRCSKQKEIKKKEKKKRRRKGRNESFVFAADVPGSERRN